jgi:predicted hydrocarbon binding protein
MGAGIAEFGGEALRDRVIVEPAYEVGKRQGAAYAREFEVQGKNAVSSSAGAVIAVETYEAKYEVPRASGGGLEMRITHCPLKDIAAQYGPEAAASCCSSCGEYLRGLVHAVNLEAQFEMPERMGWGDDSCRFEVSVKGVKPGPKKFFLPDRVKFMPATTRKEMLVDTFIRFITEATKVSQTGLEKEFAARVMSYAAYPVGKRDGRVVRDVFRITGKDLESAGLTANAMSEVEGIDYDLVTADADRYVWRGAQCPFVDLMPLDKGTASDFICEACRNYNEGLVHSAAEDYVLEIDKRLAAGDPHCEFRAERIPARRQLRRPSRGWVDLGLSRVALLDSGSTYYYIWKLLGETLEPVGRRAASDFIRKSVRLKAVAKDEEGFRRAVEALADAGYGNFSVLEADLSRPRAVFACANSFEADAALSHSEKGAPACHFTRGLLAGMTEEMSGLRGLVSEERQCTARGDGRCEFVVERAG